MLLRVDVPSHTGDSRLLSAQISSLCSSAYRGVCTHNRDKVASLRPMATAGHTITCSSWKDTACGRNPHPGSICATMCAVSSAQGAASSAGKLLACCHCRNKPHTQLPQTLRSRSHQHQSSGCWPRCCNGRDPTVSPHHSPQLLPKILPQTL